MISESRKAANIQGDDPALKARILESTTAANAHGSANNPLFSSAGRYNIQTVVTAITASICAAICAELGWPVWAMFLGWVATFPAGDSFKDASRGYICLAAGIGIGTAGSLAVGALSPSIGPLAIALTVLGMATIIVSMRKAPFANIVPNYILGVVGVFALHPSLAGIVVVKIAAPSAVGSLGVLLANRLQKKIAKLGSPSTLNR